jgi:PTS system nitrogen regulatory IIA component
MDLSDLLGPSAIRTHSTATSKKRVFHEIGDVAAACYGLPAHETVDALLERESLGPTGVGHGVALPHARVQGLDRVKGIFLRFEKPVEFNSIDRLPVDLVFALLAPEAAGVEHLKALAAVSRTMRDTGICAKLRANSDPVTLHAVLTEGPAIQAA